METTTTAGTPVAGAVRASALNSHPSTEENMTSPTNVRTLDSADFQKIDPVTNKLAAKLGITIVGCAKAFNAYKDGDIISPDCTPDELLAWLSGYDAGKDDPVIIEQIEQVAPLLGEVGKAEIVIQVLMAQMSTKQRKAAAGALQVAGFSFADPIRMKARQAVVSDARSAMAAAAASGGAA